MGSSSLIKRLLWNPHLKAVRNGLTLTLPLVIAGCVAMLVANFPVRDYQDYMTERFGDNWQLICSQIANGTFSILAVIMLLTISFSLAEYHNSKAGNRDMHPAVAALVSLACLIALGQSYTLAEGPNTPPGAGIAYFWLGIHGLFISIIVAFVSTGIFFRLKNVSWLNISFYSEEADASVAYAFSAMLPGMLTIMVFALVKALAHMAGIDSIHQSLYDVMSEPFTRMGNTFGTALFYTFLRHFFWFFGIHGTNLLEPMATSIYEPAMEANIAAFNAGLPPEHIFNKTFFDAFLAMGGSGSTICLLLAIFLFNRRGSMYKISQISLVPALFNINEMIMFGLPIVLNPIFFIPFIIVPLVQCTVTYLAMILGLVPLAVANVDWTAPAFISGYVATYSVAGVVMQVVNIILGVVIYVPFVRMADRVKQESFNQAFRELMPGYAESIGNADYVITGEAKALSRSLANDLADAVRRNEMTLEYQPQVESTTGRVFGVEALMRWDHSHLGRIPPGLFITLAEESSLIKPLGRWALEEACRQWAEWRDGGVGDVVMSVNLSVHQLDDEVILEEIGERLERYSIPKGMLEVEVTESAALGGDERAGILEKIHNLGVSLAIDDFGMGHSSLVYLKQFPVDTIKIDRVLSKDVVTSRHSSEIINTIAELCRSLGIHSLVEFVDNPEQLKVLQNLGCTRIQGWLYSPSLPPDRCLEYIKAGAPVYWASQAGGA